ncbi:MULTISPECIES: hypothetical protein [unclassified Pseudomonas]|nr:MULTISPECIES: hypothetical protein [unclassified Pseudomonas]
MTVSNIATPVLTSLSAPMAPVPPAVSAAISQAPNPEVGSTSLPRMQNLGLTSLRQTVMQGISDQLSSYVSPRLSMNSEQTKGAALTLAGGMAKVVGQSMTKSGGASSKAVGTALIWGGKTAEKIGKGTYKEAGKDHGTGDYNAFAPRNWAK